MATAIASLSPAGEVRAQPLTDPWAPVEEATDEEGQVVAFIQPGRGTLGLTDAFSGISHLELQPLLVQRWAAIVRQRLDAGCGPASLATIYTHYLDLPVEERDMSRALTAEALRSGRDRSHIQARGYAMGDLKRVVDRSPLVSAAFQAPVETLKTLKIPVITQVNIRGYGHFVVLRGMIGDRVIVADPNFGNMTYPIGQFDDIWSGVMLAIGRPKQQAVAGSVVDVTDLPMVKEIDYAAFIKQLNPSNMPMLRYSTHGSVLSVTLGNVLRGSQAFPLIGQGSTVVQRNW